MTRVTEHWSKTDNGRGMYYDICCGEVYQNATVKDDPEKLISLVCHRWRTFGEVQIDDLWPIQCFVVELPPKLILLFQYFSFRSFM